MVTPKHSHVLFIIILLSALAPAAKLFAQVKEKSFQDSIYHVNQWKLTSFAKAKLKEEKRTDEKFILSSNNLKNLLTVIQHLPGVEIKHIDYPSGSIIVTTNSKNARLYLVGLKEVVFIDLVQKAKAEIGIIGYDRSYHGINAVDYLLPGANGRNRVAGVKEHKMRETDLDLWKRVLPSSIASNTVSNHATVIASIIGGAGNSFYDGRGIAWGVRFFPSSFDNLFPDDANILNSNNVTVQNHSYGTVIQQFYGAEAVSYDAQLWSNKQLVHIFSAGNQGTSFAAEGRYENIPGFANLTGNFKMAKNIITVAAIDNKGIIPAESSSGPVYDGRLAPQITALGPNGTSDAAAIVSGTVAVMQQVYADSNNQVVPPASLVKSVLYNTAEDIHREGIDYKTGYGLLDSYKAIVSLQNKEFDGSVLQTGQSWTKNISVPGNAAMLKVTLAWTDTSAPVNNTKALVNDLDLEVTALNSGNVFKPWVLSNLAIADSLVKLPVRKRDSLNTAEQVSLKLPIAGNYQVKVSSTTQLNNNLAFHIAYHVDTLNTFMFTSPLHTADVNRQENPVLNVKWKTFVVDTNHTGSLFISYDRGSTWRIVVSNYKIYRNQYQWSIPDTMSTGVFKMETSFGFYYSKEFIISPVLRPRLDFLCTDSFRISWPKHVYTNLYQVWVLTDSPYLKRFQIVSDTFIVINRAVTSNEIFAIEPLPSNGIPAARSRAMDINFQATNCFYRALNYSILDQNTINLTLELGVASYVDSIYFEKVSSAGQLLQVYGGSKAIDNVLIYDWLIQDVQPGLIYVKARIKLKSGQVVYTNVISILTSGNKAIVFYPNPVSRSEVLHYVYRQGMPFDIEVKLYDISGRLLHSVPLAAEIHVARLSAGIIIYKLYSASQGLIETGKLIVQ